MFISFHTWSPISHSKLAVKNYVPGRAKPGVKNPAAHMSNEQYRAAHVGHPRENGGSIVEDLLQSKVLLAKRATTVPQSCIARVLAASYL